MGMMKQCLGYAEEKLHAAVKNQANFKTLELCFCYYREESFWHAIDDGFGEDFAQDAEETFAKLFDNQFNTTFSV